MRGPSPNTSRAAIVRAQVDLIRRLPNVAPDDDPARTCWACGNSGPASFRPVRAHIHAARFGGRDEPLNYFLLCALCHDEQPDAASREVQIDWLLHRESVRERFRVRHLPKVAQFIEWLWANGIDIETATAFVRSDAAREAMRASGCGVHAVGDTFFAIARQALAQ